MLSIFSHACWPSVCLLWKNVYSGPLPILKLDCLVFFDIELYEFLYILDINPLSNVSFVDIPPFSRLSFHFVDGFLQWAKPFYFDVVLFVHFCFCFPYLRRQIQKILQRPTSKSVLPMFSSRSFMVLHPTFKSLVNFEFILIYSVRKWSSFILLIVAVQFSQHCLLKRLSFLHCMFLSPLS